MLTPEEELEFLLKLISSRIEKEDHPSILSNLSIQLAVLFTEYYQMKVLKDLSDKEQDLLANGFSMISKVLHGVKQPQVQNSAVVTAVVLDLKLVN